MRNSTVVSIRLPTAKLALLDNLAGRCLTDGKIMSRNGLVLRAISRLIDAEHEALKRRGVPIPAAADPDRCDRTAEMDIRPATVRAAADKWAADAD